MLPAGTSTVRLRATPVVLEPSWTVELTITPFSGVAPTTESGSLDLTTEEP